MANLDDRMDNDFVESTYLLTKFERRDKTKQTNKLKIQMKQK